MNMTETNLKYLIIKSLKIIIEEKAQPFKCALPKFPVRTV